MKEVFGGKGASLSSTALIECKRPYFNKEESMKIENICWEELKEKVEKAGGKEVILCNISDFPYDDDWNFFLKGNKIAEYYGIYLDVSDDHPGKVVVGKLPEPKNISPSMRGPFCTNPEKIREREKEYILQEFDWDIENGAAYIRWLSEGRMKVYEFYSLTYDMSIGVYAVKTENEKDIEFPFSILKRKGGFSLIEKK